MDILSSASCVILAPVALTTPGIKSVPHVAVEYTWTRSFASNLPTLNRDATSALGTEKIEIEVNRFSAELLMPTA